MIIRDGPDRSLEGLQALAAEIEEYPPGDVLLNGEAYASAMRIRGSEWRTAPPTYLGRRLYHAMIIRGKEIVFPA